jgi:hypothetical protein
MEGNNKSYIFFITLLFIFWGTHSFSQNITSSILQAERFTVEDGLSHRHVKGICQDERGMMWFATAYGLNRFDGYEFKWFTEEKHGLTNNDIQHIHLDHKGNIWIFSGLENDRNIDILDPITESIQPLEEAFEKKPPSSLGNNLSFSVSPDGQFAFLMRGKLILYKDDFKVISLEGESRMRDGTVFWGKGELWVWVEGL